MLKSSSIKQLYIYNCNIQEISLTAFNELGQLRELNMSGNSLTTLPQGLFDKNVYLAELDLSNNMLVLLPDSLFNNTRLEELALRNNNIGSNLGFIPPQIRKLDLTNNNITNIKNQTFRGLLHLNYLRLQGNQISNIDEQSFDTFRRLGILDLSHNDLSEISKLLFSKVSYLNMLDLSNNKRLQSLPAEGFETSRSSFDFYTFEVSHCNLSHLGENTFKKMSGTRRLKLSHNRISRLPMNVFG